MGKVFFLIVSAIVFVSINGCGADPLQKNFYELTCPQAENLVKNLIWKKIEENPEMAAKLLRLHFHDCFVRGCDASILLDRVNNSTVEKGTPPNHTLGGYEIIEYVKAELEKVCPGVVSCADLLALAARDSVSFQFKEPKWEVLTGRRDGKVSRGDELSANLPGENDTFDKLVKTFMKKGLSVQDLVVLSGAHTIGKSFCFTIDKRLNNFTGKGDQDPSIDPNYAAFLRKSCPNFFAQVPFDVDSQLTFDTHYYTNIKQHKALLTSDASLITNRRGSELVNQMENPKVFFEEFGKSMLKMGAIEVLTGTSGDIRKKCNVLN